MSDFDKEAERERLREKYEEDKQKREASERMSDLLLKGATMTNAHCNDCGDPIFRYDGDEFCPTCQRVVTNDEAVEQAAEGEGQVDEPVQTPDDAGAADADARSDQSPATENGDTPDHIEVKQPDGPAVRTGGDGSTADQSAADQPDAAPDRQNAGASQPNAAADSGASGSEPGQSQPGQPQSSQSQPSQSQPSQSQPGQPQSSQSQPTQSQGQPSRAPSASGSAASAAPAEAGDDFGAARASLVRTLRDHAERAENCEDPRRARDHLAAAREAAEALSALSGSY